MQNAEGLGRNPVKPGHLACGTLKRVLDGHQKMWNVQALNSAGRQPRWNDTRSTSKTLYYITGGKKERNTENTYYCRMVCDTPYSKKKKKPRGNLFLIFFKIKRKIKQNRFWTVRVTVNRQRVIIISRGLVSRVTLVRSKCECHGSRRSSVPVSIVKKVPAESSVVREWYEISKSRNKCRKKGYIISCTTVSAPKLCYKYFAITPWPFESRHFSLLPTTRDI